MVETIVVLFIMKFLFSFGAKLNQRFIVQISMRSSLSRDNGSLKRVFFCLSRSRTFRFLWPKKRANKLSHILEMHKRVCETVAYEKEKSSAGICSMGI